MMMITPWLVVAVETKLRKLWLVNQGKVRVSQLNLIRPAW